MSVIDKTKDFTDPSIYEAREQGVYLMLVHNAAEDAVYDRNKEGRLLVHPRSWMVKAGKFEGGLVPRMHLNYVHYHRREGDVEEEGIFPSVLKLLLVHFMTGKPVASVRALETHLKRALKALLKAEQLHVPDQPGHPESRWLRAKPGPRFAGQLKALLQEVIAKG